MKKIYIVAHTHWDFEWYFTRQEARVQFAFHMDEVLDALKNNYLDYYLLDGQMSILNDYISNFPNKKNEVIKYVKAGRLYIGPWYTQPDEMITSGESMIHNLRIGITLGNKLGGAMKIGYLPDSFGQNQDMPKLYNGFGIKNIVFWRGVPNEIKEKYFYWSSIDESKVLVINLKNGYNAGMGVLNDQDTAKTIEKSIEGTGLNFGVLPVGYDQCPVNNELKYRIKELIEEYEEKYAFLESNYPNLFIELKKKNEKDFPIYRGEFIEPSTSKIHRGIYSSRYDLKKIYDELERIMTYTINPLSVIARRFNLDSKKGMIEKIWTIISMGQAHDSSGGCNSDITNRDIYQRGINGLQLAKTLRDYMLRKLSISISNVDKGTLISWNPLPFDINEVREFEVSTVSKNFKLINSNNENVEYDILWQKKENSAKLKRDIQSMEKSYYYITKIALKDEIKATDWKAYRIEECNYCDIELADVESENEGKIENGFYELIYNKKLTLINKNNNKKYDDFVKIEDGADEGDTYDYSPAYNDWILNFDFSEAQKIYSQKGKHESTLFLEGVWNLPKNLSERSQHKRNAKVKYKISFKLENGTNVIKFKLSIDNKACDHRMRLIFNSNVESKFSYADTQFGYIERPVIDKHLSDWKEIKYHEEPTSLRPMIHFANIHSNVESLTFISKGIKEFQIVGEKFNRLAITLFRSVGFLGRPDLLRRPSKASGVTNKYIETPDSQLNKKLVFEGGIIYEKMFNPVEIQRKHLLLTQEDIYFQNQDINKYTTPIEFFNVNKISESIRHEPILFFKELNLVVSDFSLTSDESGFEIRVYNPSNKSLKNGGEITLNGNYSITTNDFSGKVKNSIASLTNKLKLKDFKPGEIRTFGFYPLNEEKR